MQKNKKNQIRGVALDMDGLLFDTERLYWHVGDTILQRRGHRYSTQLQQRMMGRVAVAAVQEMINFHDLDATPEQILEESDVLFEEALRTDLQMLPGVEELIELLIQKEIPFGLATSSRRKFVTTIFETIEWKDHLKFVLTGDDVDHGKPHPEIYLRAADALDIPASNMMVLEDSGNGCRSGINAGAITVAVPNQHTRDQPFDGVHLVAETLADPCLIELIMD